jgi:hypothetical protein
MGKWIPTEALTESDLQDIKELKTSRNKEGVLRMLLFTEEKIIKTMRDTTGAQLFRAQGIAQFLNEFSELINLK